MSAHPDAGARFPWITLQRDRLCRSHCPNALSTTIIATSPRLPWGCSPGPAGLRGGQPEMSIHPSIPKCPKMWPSIQPPNLARHRFPLPGQMWRCQCQCCTLVPAGPWVPGGPALPCRGQGDIKLGRCLLVAQDGEGAVGQHGPSTATSPCSLGGRLPLLTSPLHDSPLPMARGGSLPGVLGVLGLPGCPEGRKRWGHCRDGFSPVSPGRRDADSASIPAKNPCQVRTSLASSWQDAWGQAPTQPAGWHPQLHPAPPARSPHLHTEVGGTVTWEGDTDTYRASQHTGEAWQALQRTTSELVGEWEAASPKQPCLPPGMLPIAGVRYPAWGTYGGLGGPLNPCGPSMGPSRGGEQGVNAPYWCQRWLVWDHRTFPPSQPTFSHRVPTHRLPLSASQPSLTRETLEREMGMGSVAGNGMRSVPVVGTAWYSLGRRPCPSRQAPLAHPVGHPHPAVGTGAGSQDRQGPSHTPPGPADTQRGVPPAVPLPGALLHGAAPLAAGDLRLQTLSPLGPRSPSAPGSPCVREKTDAISPHCPPGDACPATTLSPSPAHHVVPSSVVLAAPLLSAQPRTFAPLGPAGPRSPGKPIRLPSTTSACGQGAVRAGTQGTPGRSPQGHSPPQALVPRDWTWPSMPGGVGWHPLGTIPSRSHHLPWALGALEGPASRPCPGVGRKID